MLGSAVLLVASVIGFFRDGTDRPDDAGSRSETAVAIIDFTFEPDVLMVTVGETGTWTNRDSATHTVTSDGNGPLASGDLEQDATYEMAFDEPGTYGYICTIHPTMQGTVEVTS